MEPSMNFETPTRKSLDSNLRKWKTEGSNVWPWRLLKSCCLEYQFLLISYSSSPWDSSNGWWFRILLVASTKNIYIYIYPRRIKPWDICFGRWIYTFSSVNSCWDKKQTLWGIQTSSHSLPKICWNGWNLASEMLTTCWHPCWERLPGSIRPEDMTPLKFSSLQLSLVALEVAHFTHLPSAKNHWHRTVIFRRWSWNHKYIINHLIWGSLGIKHLWSNTPIHTSPADLRPDLNRHFLWTKNRLKLGIWWSTLDAHLLNFHEVDAIFCQKWRPFGY